MAGGIFDTSVGKVRPGTYVNFVAEKKATIDKSQRGIVVVPIKGAKYGAKNSVVEITTDNADTLQSIIGFSVYDDEPTMLVIREALKKSTVVKAYIMNEGTKATVTDDNSLTATAIHGGTRGNQLTYSVVANPIANFDVKIYLSGTKVEEFTKLSTVEELVSCKSNFITFSGTGALVAITGVSLVGGTDGDTTTDELTTFLDDLENIKFNAVAFPIPGLSEQQFASIKSKIKYLRDNLGKTGQFVVSGFEADYEGIINVTNGVVLDDGTEIDAVKATAYIAAITAGAEYNESNTFKNYDSAVKVLGIKKNEEAEKAISKGELFFSMSNAGDVVIEYDINSLNSSEAMANKVDAYKKNRLIRVQDTLLDDLQSEFSPAKYNNNTEGWDLMEGIGKAILKKYESENAISDVDYEKDFCVDRAASKGDATYINIAIKPVDSAEKIYITVKTA